MRQRIFFKLMGAFLLVIAAATVTLDVAIRRAWERSLREEIERSLEEKTRLLAQRVEKDRGAPLQPMVEELARAADARATVIDSAGTVLAESQADPHTMENHASRPEFAAALQGSVGRSTRFSHTINTHLLYVAVPVPGGAVRLAYPLSAVDRTTATVRRTLVWASALALLVATLVAGIAAETMAVRLQRIVRFAEQVSSGDLAARITERSSDEIGKVAAALDLTASRLQQTFAEVEASRDQLETVLNGMQEAVIAVSADRRVQWANGQMRRLTGGNVRLAAPVVETVRDPAFLAAVQEALEQHVVRTALATSIVPGRTFRVTAAPMFKGGVVAVLADLTEIERVEKTRRDFIANVSHELRTPLTSIQGYAETLLDASDPGAQRDFLEIIAKNSARMSRLTEDLLTLARVESGEQEFALRPVKPADLLHEAEQDLRELARGRGMELSVVEGPAAPVLADSDAIQQVLANFVDNALKYAASGGRVELGARPAEGGVEFYVRDFGPGIASEHLPRLFERFYRVDKARSRESGGTGLGLAIAKHIVLAHGGRIRAESTLGQGSTFFFTLRAADGATSPGVGRG